MNALETTVAALALIALAACGSDPGEPAADPALARALRDVGAEVQALVPEYAPLYSAILGGERGAAWLAEVDPELELLEPQDVPKPGDADFGRPIVILTEDAALESRSWAAILAGGGRGVERDIALEGGARILVLRSVTGGHLPITARPDMYAGQKADREFEYDPADGGGSAWLELPDGQDGSVRAGATGRWTIVFEAGPLGVRSGGSVFLQTSPWWGWSPPQTVEPRAAGYTSFETEAAGVDLVPEELANGILRLRVERADLRPGEQIRIVYGAGERGAGADIYAEREERLWIAVDGDGDGSRRVLPDSPRIDVLPRAPERLLLTLPSIARPGETVRLVLAVLDGALDTGCELEASVVFDEWPAVLGGPPAVRIEIGDAGRTSIELVPRDPGVLRLAAHIEVDGRRIEGRSNPLLVAETGPRVRWGDLHGHTNYSDGTGLPVDYFEYARDVAALDVVALTDHDDWGLLPLSRQPDMWSEIQALVQRFHDPGRFVAILGYEWTNWIYGHRHVLYFGDEGPLLSSLDDRYDTPPELWDALRELDAITIPHHPAGDPVPIDWTVAPDPELEPVVEITSVHGTSEARDAPRNVRGALRGNFVRDALSRGYRLGIVGSGDSHDGHPGVSWFTPQYFNGGLVAIVTDDLTRAGVRAALRERRVYATNGPRILLRFALAGRPMGSSVAAADLADGAEVYVYALACEPIERVDLIRSGEVVGSLAGDGSDELGATLRLEDLTPGEFVYVRVVQADEGLAWSSPIYLD